MRVLAGNRNSASSAEAPPLNHTERKVGTWHYTLGALASHRLALRSGKQALVEFWRALLPESLGPLGRWQSNPPWQDVFQDVFGFSVEGFYSEFAEWRGNLAPLVVRGHVLESRRSRLAIRSDCWPEPAIGGRRSRLLQHDQRSGWIVCPVGFWPRICRSRSGPRRVPGSTTRPTGSFQVGIRPSS